MTEQEKALAGNSKGFLSEETDEDLPPAGEATAAARLGPIIVPNVRLKGMAWMENAELQVTLEGPISVDLARAAVKELFPPWAPREETKRFIHAVSSNRSVMNSSLSPSSQLSEEGLSAEQPPSV